MKIDFSQVITNFEGQPMREGVDEGSPESTLGTIAVNALLSTPKDKDLTGVEKKKRGDLADRVHKKGLVSLDLDEVKLIKDLIGKFFNQIIVKRAWDMLDPPDKEEEKKADEPEKAEE